MGPARPLQAPQPLRKTETTLLATETTRLGLERGVSAEKRLVSRPQRVCTRGAARRCGARDVAFRRRASRFVLKRRVSAGDVTTWVATRHVRGQNVALHARTVTFRASSLFASAREKRARTGATSRFASERRVPDRNESFRSRVDTFRSRADTFRSRADLSVARATTPKFRADPFHSGADLFRSGADLSRAGADLLRARAALSRLRADPSRAVAVSAR